MAAIKTMITGVIMEITTGIIKTGVIIEMITGVIITGMIIEMMTDDITGIRVKEKAMIGTMINFNSNITKATFGWLLYFVYCSVV